MSEDTKEEIYRPDLFVTDGSGTRLVGGCCKKCGYHTFPKYFACPNCFSDEIEDVLLNPIGKLHAFTIVRRSMPDYPVPYGLGLVDFPTNFPSAVRVMAQIESKDLENLQTETDMKIVIGAVRKNKDGGDIKSYKFARS